MKLLFFLTAICASSSVFADFVCTYVDAYALDNDGSMKRSLAYQVGEKFTMTLDGKSSGKIQGLYGPRRREEAWFYVESSSWAYVIAETQNGFRP